MSESVAAGVTGRAQSNAQRGLKKHPWLAAARHAPLGNMASRNAAQTAVEALAPWQGDRYPGRLKIISDALLGRAARYTIRDWRRGRRSLPTWAAELLIRAIDSRMAQLQHAKDLLVVEKEKARR